MQSPSLTEPGRRRFFASTLLALAFVVAVVLIWQRNRDILRDLYDYSTVVTAAGKISAGLRPYVDVRSPMQTSVYYLNWATETAFGSNYLALTWGGLIQALGGGALLAWMLRRSLGAIGAVLVAGAVMLAGLIQHVVFFYNPIGIVCFGLVATGLAANPRLWPVRSFETVMVLGALFIGGTNKMNFQGLAIAVGGLLMLRAWMAEKISTRECGTGCALLLVAGLLLPVTFELLWTGASLRQWLDEVVLLPTARYDAAKQAWDARILLEPAHDYHHHLLFRPMGGLGLAVLGAVGLWALWRKSGERWRAGDGLLRLGLLIVCAAGSALLMVTNFETVMLTSLAFLLSALALFLACRRPDVPGDRRVGQAIVACSVLWSLLGGYAAWHGSRVLYAQNPPPRSAYVRLQHASRPLAYFEGVRFPQPLLKSLQVLATRMEELERARGGMRGVLFGPAVEWLERAYPEAIVRDMPIWYHRGTSLSDADTPWFESVLRRDGVKRIVTDINWEIWPRTLEQSLSENYRGENVGERFRVYHPRTARRGLLADLSTVLPSQDDFRVAAESNVLVAATLPAAGMALQAGPRGGFFGSRGESTWAWPLGPAVVQGTATAVITGPADLPGQVIFRILAGPPGAGELLWEMPVRLRKGQRVIEQPFQVRPLGRPIRLVVRLSGGLQGRAIAGWHRLRITQAGVLQSTPMLPVGAGLQPQPTPAGELAGMWFAQPGSPPPSEGWEKAPFEYWRRQTDGFARQRIEAAFAPGGTGPESQVEITLAWYRAGRFEIMSRRTVDARTETQVALEGGVPEADGWVGLMVRPLNPNQPAPRVKIQSWRPQPVGVTHSAEPARD